MSLSLPLPVPKFFVSDLLKSPKDGGPRKATTADGGSSCWEYKGRRFCKCWVQGTVVERDREDGTLTLDDSTGLLEIDEVDPSFASVDVGNEVMVVGTPYDEDDDDDDDDAEDEEEEGIGDLRAEIINIVSEPNRISGWMLEVTELWADP